MARATVTLTGNTGPGGSVTALALDNVTALEFDFQHSMINVTHDDGKNFKLAWTGVTTVTFSISGGNATVTIS